MKSDLDRLMTERNIDALIVEGPDGLGSANPAFNYFVAGAHLTGTVIKKRGEPAMLLHSPWEQVQAAATGLQLVSSNRWNMRDILKQFPDRLDAAVEMRRQMFADLGIAGRIAVYGTVSANASYALLSAMQQRIPGIEIVAEFSKDIISQARLTKDDSELVMMRSVGEKTCRVVQAVVDYIKAGRLVDDLVFDSQDKAITIGDIKSLIGRELAAHGLEAPQGTIFAQGRDAGLPHATGDEQAVLRAGQSIVFDIFPRDKVTGYYHDMTRTFAIGYAAPELQEAHNQVHQIFEKVLGELEVGAPLKVYQDMTCEFFEQHGHKTIGSTYPLEEGYIHSLGHGLGLEVHEDYGFPGLADRGDQLQIGAILSVEPGLYYPERGFGVRIEDTIYCNQNGEIERLTPFPYELVIPVVSIQ